MNLKLFNGTNPINFINKSGTNFTFLIIAVSNYIFSNSNYQ